MIRLLDNIPSKKNSKIISCWGNRPRLFPSKAHQEWHKSASLELLSQKPPKGIENCKMEITFFPPNKRKFDLTNKAESIMDLLVDNNVIIDDNYDVVSEVVLKVSFEEKGGCLININTVS